MKRLVIDPNSMGQIGCYSLHLYCRYVHSVTELHYFPHEYDGQSQEACNKSARRDGWILHRDGYATCPDCAEILTGKPKPPERKLPGKWKAVEVKEILGLK